MSIRLDAPVQTGTARVAAVVRERLFATQAPGLPVFHASKEPVAILVARDGEVAAFDLRGRALPMDRVEAICPGAWAAFAGADG